MEKLKKIFILKGSYPDQVKILSTKNNLDKTYSFENVDEFFAQYKHLLAISKSPEYEEVRIFISPAKCRMIWFEGSSKWGTGGCIDLKTIYDIGFYDFDESTQEEIFEDLFEKHLKSDNKYIKRALTDISKPTFRDYECNFDMITAGQQLLEFALSNYLFDFYNDAMIPLSYLLPNFLTDQQLSTIIAKKYNLLDYIICDEKQKPKSYTNQTILSNTIKALLYAIYMITGNFQEIEEIVRNFITLTDTSNQNIPQIREKYKKFAEYLKNKDKYDVDESITFEEVEKIINSKLDYQFFIYANFFRDYGYRITKLDIENNVIYLDISYM